MLNTTDEEAKSSDTDIVGVTVEFDINGKHHFGIVVSVSDGKYHIQDVDTKVITPLEEGQFYIPQPDNDEEEKVVVHRKPRQNLFSTNNSNSNNNYISSEPPTKRLRSSSNVSNSSLSSSSGYSSRNRDNGFSSSNGTSEDDEMEANGREYELEEDDDNDESNNLNNSGDDYYLNDIDFTSHMDYKFDKPFFYQRWLNFLYKEQRKASNYPLLLNQKCKYCGKEYNNKNKYCWNSNCISSPCFKSKSEIRIITVNRPVKKRRIRISTNVSSNDSSPNDRNNSSNSSSNDGKSNDNDNENDTSSSFDSTDEQSFNV